MIYHGELVFAKRFGFGYNFWDREGRGTAVTPKLVPFSVSVLAVVTNKVETAICSLQHRMWFANEPARQSERQQRCTYAMILCIAYRAQWYVGYAPYLCYVGRVC